MKIYKRLYFFTIIIILILTYNCTIPSDNIQKKKKHNNNIDIRYPELTKFSGPETTNSAIISIDIEANDDKGISGYFISFDNEFPNPNDERWIIDKPTSFTLPSAGRYILYAWAKDTSDKISNYLFFNVTFNSEDTEKPVITGFSGTETISSATVNFILSGTDNVGITSWYISLNSNVPLTIDSNWKTSKPETFVLPAAGSYTLYAYAKDEAGNISNPMSFNVTFISTDISAPVITTFKGPETTSNVSLINIIIEAVDNIGITGWLIKENNIVPLPDDSLWKTVKPSSYKLPALGTYTLYAFAKDEAGNISQSKSISVTYFFNDTTVPNITEFSYTAGATSSIFNIVLSGTDNVAITSWLIKESSDMPMVSDSRWTVEVPVSYSINSPGVHTVYVWAKDDAGNISSSKSISISKRSNWTVMIHFAVDNDIDYNYEKDIGIITKYINTLKEVKALDNNQNISILVLMDSYNQDTKFSDGYYCITLNSFNSDKKVNLSEINSGNINDIKSFIDWALLNYPADHYIYSIFGYGSGFATTNIEGTDSENGFALDETQSDSLSINEVGTISDYFKSVSGKNIDLFIAHAQLMAGIEFAYELKDSTDYLIGSEEIFPVDLWSYEGLKNLLLIPNITALNLGKSICDSAYQYFSTLSVPKKFEISLIDLSKMNDLYNALDSFSTESVSYINNKAEIAQYFNNSAEISYKMCYDYSIISYYLDLLDFLNNIISSTNFSDIVKNKAIILKNYLTGCISYRRNFGYNKAYGLSIFHNIWNSGYNFSIPLYKTISNFGENSWSDYQEKMNSLTVKPEGDDYEPDNDFFTSNIMHLGDAPQSHTIHKKDDKDYIKLDLTTVPINSIIKIETYYSNINIDTMLNLFDPEKSYIFYDNDSGSLNYSKIDFKCLQNGIYYIMVEQREDINNGDYLIDAQIVQLPPVDAFEPDNNYDDAHSIILNSNIEQHTLHTIGDIDYFKLDLNGIIAGTSIIFETTFYSINTDTIIFLFDANKNLITSNDNKSESDIYSKITWQCNTPGIYYFVVREYNNKYGNYKIQVKTN